MRKGMAAVTLAGAAVLAGAGGIGEATTTTWTVHPGGALTATAGKTTLTDTKPGKGSTVPCESSRMSGTLKPGSGLPGDGIGLITTAAYRCPNPFG